MACGLGVGSLPVAPIRQVSDVVATAGESRCEMWIGEDVKRKSRTHFFDRTDSSGTMAWRVGSRRLAEFGASAAKVRISDGFGGLIGSGGIFVGCVDWEWATPSSVGFVFYFPWRPCVSSSPSM